MIDSCGRGEVMRHLMASWDCYS